MQLTGFKSNSVIADTHRQRNDCTIRALMETTGTPYNVVAMVLAAYGKRTNCGFRIYDWLKSCDNVAFGMRFYPVKEPTAKGRYLIGNKGHIWAIVNGEMRDYTGSRASRYLYCYLVLPMEKTEDEDKTASVVAKATRIHNLALED